MKLLSKAAALILGLFVVAAVRIEFLDPGFSARGGVGDWVGRIIGHIVSLLGTFSDATLLLLLVSFNLYADQESIPDAPVSRLLDRVTKIAVICYGVALAFLMIRCLLTPYTYSTLKDLAFQYGRTPPRFSSLLEEAIRTLALEASVFTAPFVIFKSMPLASAGDNEPPVIPPAILPDQP